MKKKIGVEKKLVLKKMDDRIKGRIKGFQKKKNIKRQYFY